MCNSVVENDKWAYCDCAFKKDEDIALLEDTILEYVKKGVELDFPILEVNDTSNALIHYIIDNTDVILVRYPLLRAI